MTSSLYKKGMVLGIIGLFIGVSVAPSITGDIEHKSSTEDSNDIGILSSNLGVLFEDDFNDNTKDYSKWSDDGSGTWYEQNQRTEIYLSSSGPAIGHGVESISIPVTITSTDSIIVSVDMISYISGSSGNGQLRFSVIDGSNSITIDYYRPANQLMFKQTGDPDWIVIGTRDDGSWSNQIEIFSDRLKVDMDTVTSGWISTSLFSTTTQITIDMGSKLQANGDWMLGYDNVLVQGQGINDSPVADAGGPYSDNIGETITFDGSGSYDPDGSITDYDWDIDNDGQYDDETGLNPTINVDDYWTTTGDYTIGLRVTDNDDATDTDTATVTVTENQPPDTPEIPTGDTIINTGESHEYCSLSCDPECDDIYYLFDWGDGTDTGWLGPIECGDFCESNSWDTAGEYEIKVKAKDEHNAESEWSDPLTVNVFGPEKPSIPQIICPSEVEVLYDFSIDVCAYDKNGDQVRYFINWGDGEITGWSEFYDEGSYQTFHHIYDQEYDESVKIKVKAEDATGLESNEGIYEINIIYSGLEYGGNKTASCSASNWEYIYEKHNGVILDIYADDDLYWLENAKLAVQYVHRNYDDNHWYYKFVLVLRRSVWEYDYWHQAETIYASYTSKNCDVYYGPYTCRLGGINTTDLAEPDLPVDEWADIWLGACVSLFLSTLPYSQAFLLGLALAQSILAMFQTPEEPTERIEWIPTTDTENLGSSEVLVDMRPSDSGGDDQWEVTFGAGVEYNAHKNNIALGRKNWYCTSDKKIIFNGPIPPTPDEEKIKYIGIGVYCPVDVMVYTPNNGFVISKDRCTYHGGSYEEIDLDGDGELDKYIRIPYAFYGDYSIYVRPQDDADPDETFTIIVDNGGQNITLVGDMKISELDESEPFIYTKEEPAWGVTIDGSTEGKTNTDYAYTLHSNCLYGFGAYEYLVDWGDNTSNTVVTGPFEVNESVTVSHTWTEKGTYNIRVKAKDQLGQVSDWTTLEVSMPKNKAINPLMLFIERLMERFPILEQIVQLIYVYLG